MKLTINFIDMIKLNFVFLLIIFFQCTTKTSQESRSGETWIKLAESDFQEVELLIGKPFEIKKFFQVRKPFYTDGYLIVSDKAMDPPLHVIDVKKRKWAFGLGIEGYGPGEISYIWSMDYSFTPGKFWAYNLDKIFSEFTLEDSTAKIAQKQLKPRNPEFILATDISWLTDSTLIAMRVSGKEKFIEYSHSGKVLKGYGTWEGMLPGDPPLNVAKDAFASQFTSNKSKTKFGFFSMDRDHFEILDYPSKEILVVEGPYFETPSYEVAYRSSNDPFYYMNDPEAVRTYQDFFLGENYIYMLYNGEKVSKIRSTGLVQCNKLFVINYDGKLIRNIEFDIPLTFITVDEENQILYGLSSGEDPDIIEFKL